MRRHRQPRQIVAKGHHTKTGLLVTQVAFDPVLHERVRQHALALGLSFSEAVRLLVQRGFEASSDLRRVA